jgi:hypothetical protein
MQLWLGNGGRIEEFIAILHDFSGWLRSLPLYYEHSRRVFWRHQGDTKKLMVCHASVAAGVPMHLQDPMTLVWDRHRTGYSQDHLTVTGHTVCELGQPEVYNTSSGTLIRIDTGAALGRDIAGVAFEEV